MRNIYFTDGSPEAFFSAVFDAYADKNAFITSSKALQTALNDVFIPISPVREQSVRVIEKLRNIDKKCLYEIDCVLRTPDPEREQIAFGYIRLLVKHKKPVREMLTLSEVRRATELGAKVSAERHLLTGFLRFQETKSGVFYSPCSPDNDIVDLLMPHFAARFKNSSFVIHDLSRGIAGIYNGSEWLVSPAPDAEIALSGNEEAFLKLWKKYYHTVYIPSRKNTRLMKSYMPVRYWKFMPEKQNEEIEFRES